MSGPESLKGFDYQISYSLLKTLELIVLGKTDYSIIFESLNEYEEDFNIVSPNQNEYHQIKKRIEGNNWTPGDFREIFKSFLSKDSPTTFFYFVTNGSANPDVRILKNFINSKKIPSNELLELFLPENEDIKIFKSLLSRTTIHTRFFATDDDNDPAKYLRRETCEMLSKPPFVLSQDVVTTYGNVWKLIFDYSREAKQISFDNIFSDFKALGIEVDFSPWSDYPDIREFEGRGNELDILKLKIEACKKLIIYGINGIGKTWITIKLILNNLDLFDDFCWVTISRWTSIDKIVFLISSFLYAHGHDFEAENIRKAKIPDRISQIISSLKSFKYALVIDSTNSGNDDVKEFVKGLIELGLVTEFKGFLIVTSTVHVAGYSNLDLRNNLIDEIALYGFSIDDTKKILREISDHFDEDDIESFHEAVKGHPMSIHFLKKLILKTKIIKDEIVKLKSESIEVARDWIIEKTVSQLSDESKNYLFNLSVVDGVIAYEEASFILDSNIKPKYLLKELRHYNLVNFVDDGFIIHESVRSVVYSMLTNNSLIEMHNKLADYHFQSMQVQQAKEDGILYETIMKWGFHIENLKGTKYISDMMNSLLNLSNNELQALWAVRRYGYPFDFETDDLSSSEVLVKGLIAKKLIKENEDQELKFMGNEIMFVLDKMDYWDDCFVTHLCLSRGLSGNMGYIQIFKPNYAWNNQGLLCLWEHCIEYMPVPPVPKSELIAHSEFIKKQFDSGAYDKKSDKEKKELQQMMEMDLNNISEEKDMQMERRSCPLFGHCCPGGEQQADECRAEMATSEEN